MLDTNYTSYCCRVVYSITAVLLTFKMANKIHLIIFTLHVPFYVS